MKLTKKQIIWASSIGAALFLFLVLAMIWISVSNNEIELRQQVEAQQKSNEAVFDNVWKILTQQAQVAEEYKEAFSKIYPELIAGRYAKDQGTFMKWIQESNPNFDIKLYDHLMNSIEAQRNTFTNNQNRLIDLKRQHDAYLKTFPNIVFIGGRDTTKITIITSEKTENTFKSGKDDNVKLFN